MSEFCKVRMLQPREPNSFFVDPELSALLTRLVNTLQEPAPELKQLVAVPGQDSLFLKIFKWTTVFRVFLDVIGMYQLSQLSDVNEKRWLDNVKELVDDVQEILDEISKQASRQTTIGKKSSLKGLIAAFFTSSNTNDGASFDYSLISRITDITSRLEKLNTQRITLKLLQFIRLRGGAVGGGGGGSTETIYGRDEDKNTILEMLLRDEVSDNANFSVIPIIGSAGVGKTTLARLVYDDKAVEDFKPRAWVPLYEDSNVFRISKAFLESITSKSCNLKDLDEVLVQLKEAIFGRKFLFVLDNVSTKNYGLWETLKSSFMAGAPGSKIIVTTRRVNIEFPVNLSIQPFTLEVLSDEACWFVFKRHAFNNKNYVGLQLIREKVIHMCKGLPLATSILGGLISFKWSTDEWGYLLRPRGEYLAEDNEILPMLKLSYQHLPLRLQRYFVHCAILLEDYEFQKEELVLLWIIEGLIGGTQEDELMELRGSDDNEILPVLKLSYQHLPLRLQRCFVYCANLRDDYEFEENELVHQWIAKGLIIGGEDKLIEYRGREIFQQLLQNSLLQHSSSHGSKFRMHDLVKSMARLIYEENDFRLDDVLGVNEVQLE